VKKVLIDKVIYRELDKLYEQGYAKIPDEGEIGEAQIAMVGEIEPSLLT